MPAALYAISFKPTGHVLAICSLEKQTLPDPAASADLLARLVGDKLTISASSGSPIQVDASKLAVDLVIEPAHPADVAANVYSYQVDLTSPVGTQLGDGSGKTLAVANQQLVTGFALATSGVGNLTITLSSPDPQPINAWVVFENVADPILGKSQTTGGVTSVKMTIPALNLGTYGMVFLKDGVPVTTAYVTTT